MQKVIEKGGVFNMNDNKTIYIKDGKKYEYSELLIKYDNILNNLINIAKENVNTIFLVFKGFLYGQGYKEYTNNKLYNSEITETSVLFNYEFVSFEIKNDKICSLPSNFLYEMLVKQINKDVGDIIYVETDKEEFINQMEFHKKRLQSEE